MAEMRNHAPVFDSPGAVVKPQRRRLVLALLGAGLGIAASGAWLLRALDAPIVAAVSVAAAGPGAAVRASHVPPAPAFTRGDASFDGLAARAVNERGLQQDLMTQYLNSRHPDLRDDLLALIARAPTAEVLAFAETLLADSDPARRVDGYRLLAGLPLDHEAVRMRVLRALRDERDNTALATLLQGLEPGLLAAEDADPLAAQLLALSDHSDTRVRAAVLPQLAQWSEADGLEAPYYRALGDADGAVRAAAIAGIGVANIRSARLRSALFDFAANPSEAPQDRHAALQNLLRFRLSRAEVELYRMLEREVPLHPGDS